MHIRWKLLEEEFLLKGVAFGRGTEVVARELLHAAEELGWLAEFFTAELLKFYLLRCSWSFD